jgi:hypothetical protein
VSHVSACFHHSLAEGLLGTHQGGMPGHVLSSRRDRWWQMTPPPHDRPHKPARGEPPDVRFLARADGYEIALIVPPPAAPPRPPVEPLVRLRFPGEGVEVVLTLAELAALAADVRRLWEYLLREQARRSHDD